MGALQSRASIVELSACDIIATGFAVTEKALDTRRRHYAQTMVKFKSDVP